MMDTAFSLFDSQHRTLLAQVDGFRLRISQQLDEKHRSERGQFFTSANLAHFMASMFVQRPRMLNILDAGAGAGALSTALVLAACQWKPRPEKITVTAYEIERSFGEYLSKNFDDCQEICEGAGIAFDSEILCGDFIREAADLVAGKTLFAPVQRHFNAAILNPPYKKINSASHTRRWLRNVGIETSNLYTAFLWLVIRLLDADGEMVSITPRSFCNGPYFLPFRKALLSTMSLRQIHVFDARDKAFTEDNVLQENIILHAIKSPPPETVIISTSIEPGDETVTVQDVPYSNLVHLDDPDLFIHIASDRLNQQLSQQMRGLSTTLKELGILVSTGRVVDFRVSHLLRAQPEDDTVPLIYPSHFRNGYVSWPNGQSRKPNALKVAGKEAQDLLVPAGWYVLVRRFSSKEEKRRLVAAIVTPEPVAQKSFGIENHLNYYHRDGHGLPPVFAKGLAGYLNSTVVDEYFRQFSGHTQVNATDLRNLKYPDESCLLRIGNRMGTVMLPQDQLDQIVLEELGMALNDDTSLPQSIQAKKKMDEALYILRELGLPRAQLNRRSALTLLALLDIKPETDWSNASAPLRGITEMMDYFRDYFGITYAPNTRETVRRQTVHQFLQVGLVIANPDDPHRPVNSPFTRYQIDSAALDLMRTYGTYEWDASLQTYLGKSLALKRLQVRERDMVLIPIRLPNGDEVKITAGGQNALIKQIVENFCPRYTPGGIILYLGDAGDKFRIYEREHLEKLGIVVDEHSKMPDLIVYLPEKSWLVLIEAVTSHGPIDIKRHNELKGLFAHSRAPLVFVTAFPTRRVMVKYLSEIAWETDVWIAESPSHLIHFNGERFLGPYEEI